MPIGVWIFFSVVKIINPHHLHSKKYKQLTAQTSPLLALKWPLFWRLGVEISNYTGSRIFFKISFIGMRVVPSETKNRWVYPGTPKIFESIALFWKISVFLHCDALWTYRNRLKMTFLTTPAFCLSQKIRIGRYSMIWRYIALVYPKNTNVSLSYEINLYLTMERR